MDATERNAAQQLARASLYAPGIALLLAILGIPFRGQNELADLAVAGGTIVIILAGVVTGILALCLIPTHGRQGVLTRSILGTLFSGLLLAGVIGGSLTFWRLGTERQAWIELDRKLAQLDRATGGPSPGILEIAQVTRRQAEQSEGRAREGMLLIANAADELAQAQRDFENSTQALLAAGAFDLTTLTDRRTLDRRIEVLESHREINNQLARAVEVYRQRFTSTPREYGAPPDFTPRGTVRQFNEKYRTAQRIRELEEQLTQKMIEAMTLLKQSWGQWSVDPWTGQLVFEDELTMEEFNYLVERVETIIAEQTALQQELGVHQPAAGSAPTMP